MIKILSPLGPKESDCLIFKKRYQPYLQFKCDLENVDIYQLYLEQKEYLDLIGKEVCYDIFLLKLFFSDEKRFKIKSKSNYELVMVYTLKKEKGILLDINKKRYYLNEEQASEIKSGLMAHFKSECKSEFTFELGCIDYFGADPREDKFIELKEKQTITSFTKLKQKGK